MVLFSVEMHKSDRSVHSTSQSNAHKDGLMKKGFITKAGRGRGRVGGVGYFRSFNPAELALFPECFTSQFNRRINLTMDETNQ